MSDLPLKDRIALVVGASRGIGFESALALARAGAHVVAAARTQGGLEEHIGVAGGGRRAEVVLAFEFRGSAEDIGITVHSHPTLSEVVKEAALATLGRPIHI